jgi:hypothetical protein
MPPCLPMLVREAHMAYSTTCALPWVERKWWHRWFPRRGWLHVVGYGPSLSQTWRQIDGPCLTMSGAHGFLTERGITPTWHAEMDPRAHKVAMLQPNCLTTYLIAGVCHPSVWNKLNGYDVRKFHVLSSRDTPDWLQRNEKRGAVLVGGGSEIGLAALHLAGFMGWRRFKLHGFDHSLRLGERHAGAHLGPKQQEIFWRVGERVFATTKIMVNAAIECLQTFEQYPIEVELMGDGLLQEMVRSKAVGEQVVPPSGD